MHSVLTNAKSGAVAAFLLPLMIIAGEASCARSAEGPAPKPTTTAAAKAVPQTHDAKVNLDEIFPAGRGRELVLNNCTTCHTFVPIVILQMTKEAWERNSRDHRGRVAALGDADFKLLYEYLKSNFGPGKPVPRLPGELLETWTSY